MLPLAHTAARYVKSWLGPAACPGLLALRHALSYQRSGLWGDDPDEPRSIILIREGDSGLEAFGAGEPEPAVGWLVGHHREFILHTPNAEDDTSPHRPNGGGEAWPEAVRARVGGFDREEVEVWSARPGQVARVQPKEKEKPKPKAITVRLTSRDARGFVASAPTWGLRGWGSYTALVEHGAAFGVPFGESFAALAWVFDRADGYDAVGVYTQPRFRRLGLGRTAALALIGHVLQRGKVPLWAVAPRNTPSRALAHSLGFSVAGTERLLRWPPRPPSGAEGGDGLGQC